MLHAGVCPHVCTGNDERQILGRGRRRELTRIARANDAAQMIIYLRPLIEQP